MIADGRFVMPHEEQMLFRDFVSIIEEPSKSTGVHYIQKQNSNLTEEISDLIDDICPFDWATEAFGKSPDAVNFWMGDQRAVTSSKKLSFQNLNRDGIVMPTFSAHKDPYENIYAVVRGYKDITLFPPTDLPWLPYKTCSQAIYVKNQDGSFDIKDLPEAGTVPWIAVDPQNPDLKKYPQYGNAHPINLRLNAGDVLYLPSFWFHHLKQSQGDKMFGFLYINHDCICQVFFASFLGCIAVNWWYDMEFDVRYNYFNFLQSVVNINENLGDPPWMGSISVLFCSVWIYLSLG